MAGREKQAVALAEKQARADAGRGRRAGVEKTAAEFAGLERDELRGGGRFVEFEADAGESAAEFAENAGQDGGHREAGEGDADVSLFAARERLDFATGGGEGAEDRLDAFGEGAAGGGEFDAAARAHEKLGADGGLKLHDLAAERGLRDGERLGGFAEMELARDLEEVNEVAELVRELILARHHTRRNRYFPAPQRSGIIWPNP